MCVTLNVSCVVIQICFSHIQRIITNNSFSFIQRYITNNNKMHQDLQEKTRLLKEEVTKIGIRVENLVGAPCES